MGQGVCDGAELHLSMGTFALVLGCPLSCFPACRCCSGENCTVMAPCPVWDGRWVRSLAGRH